MSNLDDWRAMLTRMSVPFTEGRVSNYKTIELSVPDVGIGRIMDEHPGAVIHLLFIRERFVGIVNVPLIESGRG